MAADDFRLLVTWVDDPKTRGLARACGPDAPRCLLRLWGFATNHATRWNGDLSGMTDAQIADAAGWPEDKPVEQFVGALAILRWIDGESGTYSLHEWCEHQPWVMERGRKTEEARERAEKRWSRDRLTDEERAARREERNRARNAARNARAPENGSAAYAAQDARARVAPPDPTRPDPTQEQEAPPRAYAAPAREAPPAVPADSPTPDKPATAAALPLEEMVNIWNETAGAAGAVRCRVVADRWKAELRRMWQDAGQDDAERLAMFRSQCEAIAASSLCTGGVAGKGAAPWRASLDWLVNATNWAKVANGNYRRDRVAPRAVEPDAQPEHARPMPPITPPTADWDRVVETIAARLPADQVDLWIRPLRYVGDRGDAIVLAVEDDFAARWVHDNFEEAIKDAFWNIERRQAAILVQVGEDDA